jgi:hypothetical protein
MCCAAQAKPVCFCRFEQYKRSVNVCVDEVFRSANGTIDMAFRGEMNNGVRAASIEDIAY